MNKFAAKMIDCQDIFDAPLAVPPPHPAYAKLPPFYEGDVPARLDGAPLSALAALILKINEQEAAEVVSFGALWLSKQRILNPQLALKKGEPFRLDVPLRGPVKYYEADPGRLVYEDKDLLVYNKEAGCPSLGVPHDDYNNCLSGLMRLLTGRGEDPAALRLMHRLDADTSGLLLFAKNARAAAHFGRAFQRNEIDKTYLALAQGQGLPDREFTINAAITREKNRCKVAEKGLYAETSFKVLKAEKNGVLFMAQPKTGRTHQIRVHLAHAGWPIDGDRFYGGAPAPRLMLKAAALGFQHPATQEKMLISLGGNG